MEKIARRSFCGTALLAFPLMRLYANPQECDNCTDPSDPVMDILAEEFRRTTADGAENGFKADHYRQYASQIRILDARLESKGLNAEFNRRLEEDDFHQFNPARVAKSTADYWKKHGIILDENDLTARFSIDHADYYRMQKAIKKQGGIRALHASIAEALERKAREQGSVALKGVAELRNGRIVLPSRANSSRPSKFMTIQYELPPYDIPYMFGLNLDCLCRSMATVGAALSVLCSWGVVAFCEPAGIILGIELLLESLKLCDPGRC